MESKIKALKQLLYEASDLRMAQAVLDWDQSTFMPEGGAPARARQTALLARLAQEKATDPRIGHLLDELQGLRREPALRAPRRGPGARRPPRLRAPPEGAARPSWAR